MPLLLIVTVMVSPAEAAFDHQFPLWAKVLKENAVSKDSFAGKGALTEVHYSQLKTKSGDLEAFLKLCQELPAAEFEAWAPNQKLAFLLNFYNAVTFKLVIDNWPVKSFKDIGGLFANPWNRKNVFKFLGEKMSLDLLEKQYISKVSNSPLYIFGMTKSARGGPRLQAEPFLAAKVDQELEEASRLFVSDRTRNGYEPKSNTFEVSSLFKWHRDDFMKGSGSVQKFLAERMKIEPPLSESALAKANVKYLEFDWKLDGN